MVFHFLSAAFGKKQYANSKSRALIGGLLGKSSVSHKGRAIHGDHSCQKSCKFKTSHYDSRQFQDERNWQITKSKIWQALREQLLSKPNNGMQMDWHHGSDFCGKFKLVASAQWSGKLRVSHWCWALEKIKKHNCIFKCMLSQKDLRKYKKSQKPRYFWKYQGARKSSATIKNKKH